MTEPDDHRHRLRRHSARNSDTPSVPPGVLVGAVMLGLLLWGGIHYYGGGPRSALDTAWAEARGALFVLLIPIALAIAIVPILRRMRRRHEASILDQLDGQGTDETSEDRK